MALEALACMEQWLQAQSANEARVAADMIFSAVDGYMREQDMVNLRADDVLLVDGGSEVILFFGRSVKGDRSKTGRDQGVTLDEPYVRQILCKRVAAAQQRKDKRVFPIAASGYRHWWRKATEAVLGTGQGGPPHSARHTGASRDLAEGYRTFEQVQRRGRWKVPGSVQRYAKTHVWRAVSHQLPDDIRARGADILSLRPHRSPHASE